VPDSQYWEIPMFNEQIRLGHAFTKVGQKTPQKDLEAMKAIREEDLAHDR
jgi:phage-related protein